MSKIEWTVLKEEERELTRQIAALTDRPPEDSDLQELIARRHVMIEQFYPASAEMDRGLVSFKTMRSSGNTLKNTAPVWPI